LLPRRHAASLRFVSAATAGTSVSSWLTAAHIGRPPALRARGEQRSRIRGRWRLHQLEHVFDHTCVVRPR
jgi:hypothetical protein